MIGVLLFVAGLIGAMLGCRDEGREQSYSGASSSSYRSSSFPEIPLNTEPKVHTDYLKLLNSLTSQDSLGSYSKPYIPHKEVLLRTEITVEKFRAYPYERRAIYGLGDEREEYHY